MPGRDHRGQGPPAAVDEGVALVLSPPRERPMLGSPGSPGCLGSASASDPSPRKACLLTLTSVSCVPGRRL